MDYWRLCEIKLSDRTKYLQCDPSIRYCYPIAASNWEAFRFGQFSLIEKLAGSYLTLRLSIWGRRLSTQSIPQPRCVIIRLTYIVALIASMSKRLGYPIISHETWSIIKWGNCRRPQGILHKYLDLHLKQNNGRILIFIWTILDYQSER